jgi:hypothetical protein
VTDGTERTRWIWRHRFIVDRWIRELPGVYLDRGEDGRAGPSGRQRRS